MNTKRRISQAAERAKQAAPAPAGKPLQDVDLTGLVLDRDAIRRHFYSGWRQEGNPAALIALCGNERQAAALVDWLNGEHDNAPVIVECRLDPETGEHQSRLEFQGEPLAMDTEAAYAVVYEWDKAEHRYFYFEQRPSSSFSPPTEHQCAANFIHQRRLHRKWLPIEYRRDRYDWLPPRG